EGTVKEQNAGRDLDALLDKISSIVDRSPKNSDELENIDKLSDKSKPMLESDNSAVESVENQFEGKEEELGAAKPEEKKSSETSNINACSNVETESEIDTENKSEGKDIKDTADPTKDKPALESSTDALEKHKEEDQEKNPEENLSSAAEEGEDKTSTKINTSEDVFEDALDNISSGDEFEAVGSKKSKKTKTGDVKKSIDNDLEDISSDDDDILNDIKADKTKQPSKSSTDVIELDSSDESTEVKESEIPDDTDEKEKEGTGEAASAELVEAIEESKTKELEEEAPKLVEGGESKAAEVEEEKAVKDPEEAMWLVKKKPKDAAGKQQDKGKAKNITESQEMNDTNIDDLLMEANSQGSGKENHKTEQNGEQRTAKVNGVSKTASILEGKGKDQEAEVENKEAAKEPESDDEVIFFESIEKSKKADAEEDPNGEKVQEPEAPKPAESNKDDEVVLVSEDEDDEPPAPKTAEEPPETIVKKSVSTEALNNSTADKSLHVDNSDNACDQFEKVKLPVKEKTGCMENGNSNSSSNLLRPAEDVPEPVPKRARMSTDEKLASDLESFEAQKTAPGEGKMAVTKRSHDHLDVEVDTQGKQEGPNKKLKTDDSDSSSCEGNLQIDLDDEADKDQSKEEEVKVQEKMELVLELKPEPDIKTDVKPFKMEFVKNFRKSFDQMTRNDLEELVLQKVVEGMLVKSEFADAIAQMERYETTLAAYRRKMAEVSKQFLDLDTVHKRVLKDLESKNSHFTAPVRITRAVGLQVGIPFKAMKPSVAAPEQPSTSSAGSGMLAPPSSTPPKASTSPMRSPMRPRPPVPSPNTSPQHNQPEQPQQRATTSIGQPPPASPPNSVVPVRRGCMQKVTPQRPSAGNVLPIPQINNQPNIHRLPPSPQRALQASKAGGNTASIAAAAAAKAAAMRQRNSGQNFVPQKAQQQPQQYQPSRGGPAPGPAKAVPKCTTKVRPMAPPNSGGTVSVATSSAAAPEVPAGYSLQPQTSLTPAKPKDKAVIDLTDEDDANAAAKATIEANARMRQAANLAVKRNAVAAAAAAMAAAGPGAAAGRPGNGNVVRASPMQLARTNARQMVQNPPGVTGQRHSVGSNVTMQIRSENTPPASGRLRYSHPAPLPTSPLQPFSPAWRLPPSRPVIRISLLDTGIVISWTLEDTSVRYADCVTYQIYAYQETIHEPSTDSWRHVGDVKAMLLPMAVTLNQFQENQRYYFAVRGVDDHQRFGAFSLPKTWS
ncbi:hypothetical protein KR074_008724, partial [Drosophila pseudoananassae]